jgi:SagB-type dehydrogenase family enzyme
LSAAAIGQRAVSDAPCVFIITGIYERTTGKYRDRGMRYVHYEAGHVAQNILLQATARGLAGVPVGAFQDEEIAKELELKDRELPLYLIPVGKP